MTAGDMVENVLVIDIVVYEVPGYFGYDRVIREIDVRDEQVAFDNAPDRAVSFYFAQVVRATVQEDTEEATLYSEERKKSGVYYIRATLASLLSKKRPIDPYELRGIKQMGAQQAVRRHDGTHRPFFSSQGDAILPRATARRAM